MKINCRDVLFVNRYPQIMALKINLIHATGAILDFSRFHDMNCFKHFEQK